MSGLRLSKTLIWTFSALIVVLTWATVIQQYRFEKERAVGAAVRQNVNRVIAFEQYVTRTLEAADVATLHIAERFAAGDPSVVGTPERIAHLTGPVVASNTFLGISIVNARGEMIATSLSPPPPTRQVAHHPAFQAHVENDNGQLFVSQPGDSSVLNKPILWLSRRLNNPDGSFAGVVAINIAPEQFTGFYRDASLQPTDVMSVIGLDGITRARRTGDVHSSGEDLSGRLVMRMQMHSPNGTYRGPSGLDGLVRYFSHRRLPGYPLFVTYGVLHDDVVRPARDRAIAFGIGAMIVTLMAIAFAALLAAFIDRRERRAEEMADTNRRLEEAQRIGQIGDWTFDLATGEVEWSPPLFALFERDPASGPPSREDVDTYLDAEGRRTLGKAIARAIETGEPQDYELRIQLPSGREVYHQVSAMPIRDAAGRVVALHGTDQDISARKLLDRLQAEVAHLSRVDAMNAMATTLAHEINQPLTAASNYLAGSRRKMKTRRPEALADTEAGMAAAEQQIHLAANIIRRVREMVSKGSDAPERASLPKIVDDAIALVSIANDYPAVAIHRGFDPGARQIRADPIQIQQVLINLLRNALDATRGMEEPKVAILSRRQSDDWILVCVEDNGPGPPAGEDGFSPFSTSKEEGLGLGLSISRTIIESHGGHIWIDARPGGGTRVSFTLPVPRRAKGAAKREPAAA